MKFLVLLTISAASAVTVYRNDDSMAMETRPPTHQRPKQFSEDTPEDQQSAPYTVYPKQEQWHTGYPKPQKPNDERFKERQKLNEDQRYFKQRQNEDQQRYLKQKQNEEQRYVKQERQKPNFEGQQKRIKDDRPKTRPKKYQTEPSTPQFFEPILEQANNGHKMGYSSVIQHQDDSDAAGEGSSDIQKTAPKSSVQFEMYHGPTEQVTRNPVKEAALGKLKNKPKVYQDALNNYKKSKNSFTGSSNTTPILVKELQSTTPKYFTPSQPKFQPAPKRRPYHKRPETDTLFQAAESTPTKTEATSHSEANLGAQSKYGQHLSQRYLKHGKPEATTQKSTIVHHVHGKTESPLFEIRGPRWTALSDSIEIATSEEVKPKPKRSRYQKEINSGQFSSHGQFFNPDPQHFDHEKALRSSTSFGVNNVMFGGEFDDEVKQTVLDGGSAFNIAYSNDIAKAVEAQQIGADQGPVKFANERGQKRIPKQNTVTSGGFEIPVMTEEEFERYFGKYRQEGKKSYRRVPFDARAKQIPQPKQQALSFSQFNGNVFAQSQNAQYPNVEMFPSMSYNFVPSRRNVSLVPERHGRVLGEDSNEPQQFSVSASYQIDRNHGGLNK